jgi:hypothetical protein
MNMASNPIIANNNNCAMGTPSNQTGGNWYSDFATIPSADIYGDAVYGATTYIPQGGTTISRPPISGQAVNPVVPANSTADSSTTTDWEFLDFSANATDGAATRLRSDPTFRIAIYCIGLYGNVNAATDPWDVVDDTLLNRIANTTASTSYNPNQPVGQYVTTPDASQLSSAFAQVASAIVARLSK